MSYHIPKPCPLLDMKSLPARKQNRVRQLKSLTKTQKGIAKISNFFRAGQGRPRKTAVSDVYRKAKVRINTKFKPYKKTTTMKTMKDFAAQQLSKRQMNEVNGGVLVLECKWQDGRYTIITADQLDEVIASGGNCQPI